MQHTPTWIEGAMKKGLPNCPYEQPKSMVVWAVVSCRLSIGTAYLIVWKSVYANTCHLHCVSMMEYLINDWICPRVHRNAFVLKQSRQTHECTLHSSRGLGKSFRSLMNASLHWIYWIMNFHVWYLAFAVFRKTAQERTPCKTTWPARADWRSLMRTKCFFLFPKSRRMNWSIKIRSERAFQNLFSACALIQPDVTQNTATELLDRFMLCVVYCSCIMFMWSTSDLAAGKACFRGRTNQIWKTKGNGSKNELFFHLNMNAQGACTL